MSISHQELQEFPPVMHLLRSFCSDGSKGHFLNFYYGFSLKCFLGLCLLNSKFVQIFTLLKKKIKATKIYHSSHETLPLLEPRIHQRHHYDMPHLSRRTANMIWNPNRYRCSDLIQVQAKTSSIRKASSVRWKLLRNQSVQLAGKQTKGRTWCINEDMP